MKKNLLKINIISLICLCISCYDVNYNNPEDRYSGLYIRNNPKLSEIVISDGILSPEFDPDITEYTVNLSHLISSVTISPTAVNNNSVIQINGSPVVSGTISTPIALNIGDNEVIINITSEDLTETLEYIIRIHSYDNDFSTFSFLKSNNVSYLNEDISGTVDTASATIYIDALYCNISNLVATFTANKNASVKIGNILQKSDVTVNNFSSSVIYTITYTVPSSKVTISKDYTVIVFNGKRISYLKAPNNSNIDQFGYSVSISGDTMAVGSPYETSSTNTIINGADLSSTNNNGSSNGAVYVFRRNGFIWTHEAYLKAPNNSNYIYGGALFGYSVSISGDTIAVGAPNEGGTTTTIINGSDLSSTNNDGYYNGAVYVFRRVGTTWSHEAYLKAPNNSNYDQFGYSVSISGDTIVVGATYETSTTNIIINGSDLSSTNNNGFDNGAAYVFRRTGTTWKHEAYLKAPNNSTYFGRFGYSVSISGDTIAVGAISERSTTTEIINGSDLTSSPNYGGDDNGAIYVFRRAVSSWTHEAYLKAPNNLNRNWFGYSVSISEDTIAVSALCERSTTSEIIYGSDLSSTNYNGENNGAVYVFRRNGSIWTHEAYLKAPNNSNNDLFGASVSISGSFIAVGAITENSTTTSVIYGSDLGSSNNDGSGNGAVYMFRRAGSTWTNEAYLKAPNNSNGDWFGYSVSISGATIVIGARYEASTTTSIINGSNLSSTNNAGNKNGAVYVFH